MASIDLTDAYYSVPVHVVYQKFLKFQYGGQFYKFTCLPNGLSSAPRDFTKLLKPVLAALRENGYISSTHLDDVFLSGSTSGQCRQNVHTLDLLSSLGFTINMEKSVTTPTTKIEHLGFVINSMEMTIALNSDKIVNIKQWCQFLLHSTECKVKIAAKVVGILVSSLPGVAHKRLYYRQLELDKSFALKANLGNFDALMSVSNLTKEHLRWWLNHAASNKNCISYGNPTITLQTDSSLLGWGQNV
jgi:hypothetical protein